MNRTIAWLVTLGLAAGAWCPAADYPLPRLSPSGRLPFAQKKDAANSKDDKDKEIRFLSFGSLESLSSLVSLLRGQHP